MGQPIQTLTAHVGQPQLWNWGASVLPNERIFAGFTYRTHVAIRLVYLLFETFPKLFNNHLWLSNLVYLNSSVKSNLWRSNKQHLPDIRNASVFKKYFRTEPGNAMFKENEITYFEEPYNKSLAHSNYIWTQVRAFSVKKTTMFLVRGIPYNQHIDYLTLYKRLRDPKPIDFSLHWEHYVLTRWLCIRPLKARLSAETLQLTSKENAQRVPPYLWF